MFHTTLKFVAGICFLSLFILSCESSVTSDNQTANNSMIESSDISAESVLSPDTRKVLAGIRSATAAYHDADKAIADGYIEVTPFIPGMGYHFVNGGLMDDEIDPYAPEALVYIHNPANDSKRRLVAVEYIYPGPTVADGFDVSLLDDMFPGIDGDQWHYVGGVGWTLHAWVWYPNPDGVFHATNSRVGDGS